MMETSERGPASWLRRREFMVYVHTVGRTMETADVRQRDGSRPRPCSGGNGRPSR